ncbi:ATP-binding protein [Anoxybacillus ayderensis]|uniref:ATP-binding protein n=1 Tax=Anoxybacillus ayderensis TaxID=265546 RepID=UPI002E1E013E|nr:ATP-binding protein [Anoxybacillus ayderensis]
MNTLDIRKENDLIQSFQLASEFVEKKYLAELTSHEVVPIPPHVENVTVRHHIRLFKITKIVYDRNEDISEKLISVFNTVGNLNHSLLFILDSKQEYVDLYIGVRAIDLHQNVNEAKEGLRKSFHGHFPGTELYNLRNSEIEEVIDDLFQSRFSESNKIITSVSGIPALKDVDKKSYVQGLEKLIDSMKGEVFSAIFIADPVQPKTLAQIYQGYETLYSQLVPFQHTDLSFSENDSKAVTDGISKSVTNTISESIAETQSYTKGSTEGSTRHESVSKGRNAGLSFLLSLGTNRTWTEGTTFSSTLNTSDTEGTTTTTGESKSNTTTTSKSEMITEGASRSLQIKFENKSVTSLLEKIDEQLKRLKSSEDYGLWNCACYFVAEDVQTAKVAASTYQSIMRGDNSSVEHSVINTWNRDNYKNLEIVTKYLKKLHHPLIRLEVNNGLNVPHVSPGTLINGKELTISLALPRKSVSGLPVVETAEFGRNVWTYDVDDEKKKKVKIGKVFHMGRAEKTEVFLDLQSLSMHTFITGSTGSGKSNTVYTLLNRLEQENIKFLVIEPAKGEYKQVFGGRKNVHVFGTNPAFATLLKINPFQFPENIHVLEHIDRLIEIFNACWPMYAAMPAILKEAVEQTYEKCGWDLEESINIYGNPIFPTFQELLVTLPEVIDRSSYSQDTKNDYIGALVTRVHSLTNGLIGRVFSGEEIDNEVLFNQNCLIDLSRIGSSETKALLMGILLMRLQEHRMSSSSQINHELKHVTVLEEAHHLLRRTSLDQSQEGVNLQGKAVEMLTNAIAEMRTYGEGFIIVDQSPGLLDRSVIRNTNTKIILRLPDKHDREDIGQAATLNEQQINEVAKLKTGVAVVFQNNWVEPVLCEIDEFKHVTPYIHVNDVDKGNKKMKADIIKLLLSGRVLAEQRLDLSYLDIHSLVKWLEHSQMRLKEKQTLIDNLRQYMKMGTMDIWKQQCFEELSHLITIFLPVEKLLRLAKNTENFDQWNERISLALRKHVDFNGNDAYEKALIQCILRKQSKEHDEFRDFYFKWIEHYRRGSVV